MAKLLLTNISVMPGFLEYLQLYGAKSNQFECGYGGGKYELHFQNESTKQKLPILRQYGT